MIIRTLADVDGSSDHVVAETWHSRRLLLARDRMGFSLHDTVINAGTVTRMWYKHHLEAVYCIEGEGSLEDLATGEVHEIVAGTLYALDRHDRHVLRARTEMRMLCVFNPPCTGRETHDADGAYPLLVDEIDGEDGADRTDDVDGIDAVLTGDGPRSAGEAPEEVARA